MWFWIVASAIFLTVFIVLEELIYFIWNRYVFGAREKKVRMKKWLSMFVRLKHIFRKNGNQLVHTDTEKSSPGN